MKPIETAPTDGTVFLGVGNGMYAACYIEVGWHPTHWIDLETVAD